MWTLIESIHVPSWFVDWLAPIASAIACIAAARALYYATVALRAKSRMRDLIKIKAKHDAWLKEIVAKAASQPLSPAEFHAIIQMIEAEAAKASFPQKERQILSEGMHQHSANGSKQFVRDVLGVQAAA